MTLVDQAQRFADQHRLRFVEELKSFVRFPSVSAQTARAGDVAACAAWLAGHLRRIGLTRVTVWPTGGHPVIYAESPPLPDRPTVLFYGHYDVQPEDPVGEWLSPPFEPVVRDESLFGRGASDDKGQLFVHIKAIEAWLRGIGALPINIKCLFEGEEEIGSPHLDALLIEKRRVLAADAAVVSDMAMRALGRPAITYALRGSLGLELRLSGQQQDLHSGLYGGAVYNPLQALCELLAAFHDQDGRVAVPGFYDKVRSVSAKERAYLARFAPNDAELLRHAEAHGGWGERGYSLYERTTIRPALTINGLTGGYQGEGGKGVIPSQASAKLNIRLVPDQDPEEIGHLLRRFVAAQVPHGLRRRLEIRQSASPLLMRPEGRATQAAIAACHHVFGVAPIFLRSGGTIPVVNSLHRLLGLPVLLLGFALPDDRAHGSNEKFHLPTFQRAIYTMVQFMDEMNEKGSPAGDHQYNVQIGSPVVNHRGVKI
jgi:acetylornithine deacetylase/succinyl-diaminopimelate desuccinylase-like protein